MGFLEWLTSMGLAFYGWLFPLVFGYAYIKEQGNIFVGILICALAIPIEIILYRLNKRIKERIEQKARAIKQKFEGERLKAEAERIALLREREQEREKAEKERLERIKTSPVKNLTPLQFEEYTKLYLEARNYKKVSLTRTSGDFGADVIATAPDNVRICVQCKKHSKPVGVSAIQEIHSAKSYYKCRRAAVVATSAGFTKQAIELSEKVKVSLFVFDDYAHEFAPINSCAQTLLSEKVSLYEQNKNK